MHNFQLTTNEIQKRPTRGPINVVDNRTTSKDNNKNQTTNIICDQNSMSIIKKIIITKLKLNQKKPIQNKIAYFSLEKIWDVSSMLLDNRSTKNSKKFKNTFLFLKTINSTVINVIRYQLKSLKRLFISPLEAIEIFHYPMFNCAKFQSQWGQR